MKDKKFLILHIFTEPEQYLADANILLDFLLIKISMIRGCNNYNMIK